MNLGSNCCRKLRAQEREREREREKKKEGNGFVFLFEVFVFAHWGGVFVLDRRADSCPEVSFFRWT